MLNYHSEVLPDRQWQILPPFLFQTHHFLAILFQGQRANYSARILGHSVWPLFGRLLSRRPCRNFFLLQSYFAIPRALARFFLLLPSRPLWHFVFLSSFAQELLSLQ